MNQNRVIELSLLASLAVLSIVVLFARFAR